MLYVILCSQELILILHSYKLDNPDADVNVDILVATSKLSGNLTPNLVSRWLHVGEFLINVKFFVFTEILVYTFYGTSK